MKYRDILGPHSHWPPWRGVGGVMRGSHSRDIELSFAIRITKIGRVFTELQLLELGEIIGTKLNVVIF